MSNSLWPRGLQHSRFPFLHFHVHWVIMLSRPSHPLPPFLLWPSIFPRMSFPVSWLFAGGQSIGASTSASVLPKNIQGWFPLGLTTLISLLFRGLSRVFPGTTIQKYQFFSALSLISIECWVIFHPFSSPLHLYIALRLSQILCKKPTQCFIPREVLNQ